VTAGQGVQAAPHEFTVSAKQPIFPEQEWVLLMQLQVPDVHV
jgi:hypothetical protein